MMDREENKARLLRRLLFALVVTLVFEGLLRKFFVSFSNIIFFMKDFLAFVIGAVLLTCHIPRGGRWFLAGYWMLCLMFLPLIVLTWVHDPLLAVFGTKQYLLFPLVALAAAVAFSEGSDEEVARFFRSAAFFIIPTTLLALAQLGLGGNNWLNMTVGGTSMEDFSAGGELRVSSTFPFVAQYTMFLNAQMYIISFPLFTKIKAQTGWSSVLYILLLPLLILGIFATGSRGAVLGGLFIAGLSWGLTLMRGRIKGAAWMVTLAGLGLVALVWVKAVFPDAFAAYDARSAGSAEQSHTKEMSERVIGVLTGWTSGIQGAPPTLFGYGLGVMSNGSEKLSQYAASWRRGGRWTETDLATTLFEGGYYLIVIWIGFRIMVLGVLFLLYLQGKLSTFYLPATFCLAYLLVVGPIATLSIQPPQAIWFWLATGVLIAVLSRGDRPRTLDGIDLNGTTEAAAEVIGRRGRSVYAERLHAMSDD